jgi:hypothetical protein
MAITKATASSIAPAAKGDLVAGSATNDAAVLGVGANDTVLTADSTEATGLKWAAPAGGGSNFTLLNSGARTFPSGTNVKTISGISGIETILVLLRNVQCGANDLQFRINGDSSSLYEQSGSKFTAAASYTISSLIDDEGTEDASLWTIARNESGSECAASILITGGKSTGFKVATMLGSGTGTGNQGARHTTGVYRGSAAITSIEVRATGNFVGAGDIAVYGA